MKYLYLKLIDTLTSTEANGLFASKALPPVKFMDLYMGQEQVSEIQIIKLNELAELLPNRG